MFWPSDNILWRVQQSSVSVHTNGWNIKKIDVMRCTYSSCIIYRYSWMLMSYNGNSSCYIYLRTYMPQSTYVCFIYQFSKWRNASTNSLNFWSLSFDVTLYIYNTFYVLSWAWFVLLSVDMPNLKAEKQTVFSPCTIIISVQQIIVKRWLVFRFQYFSVKSMN